MVNRMSRKVRINLNESGLGQVFLDGEDITQFVSRVSFTAAAGTIPRVDLELISNVEVKADAEVTETTVVQHPSISIQPDLGGDAA